MTENANPKPFNISRLKCQRRNKLERQLSWVYQSINQSINQSKDAFMVKLAEQNSNQRL